MLDCDVDSNPQVQRSSEIAEEFAAPLVENQVLISAENQVLNQVLISESLQRLRCRYLYHLGHYAKIPQTYVPNIGPLLTGNTLAPPIRSPAPDVAEDRSYFGPGGIKSSVINVSAATLGAGALALPRAFYLSGLVSGLVIMLFLYILSEYSISLLVRAIEVSGLSTYEELSLHYLGRRAALFIEFNMIFLCFGTAVAYAIVIGSSAQSVLQMCGVDCDGSTIGAIVCTKSIPLTVITFVILLPLSLLDQLNELRYTSLAGVFCILYLIVVVTYVFIGKIAANELPDSIALAPHSSLGIVKMLSLAVFAFCCHPNVPGIYVELERRSFRRMTKISRSSMSLCLIIYVLMGVHGYLAFGSSVKANVLDNLGGRSQDSDVPVTIAFIAMTSAVIMSYPLSIFPVRYSVETLVLFQWPELEAKRKFVRIVITVSSVLLALFFATIIPDIEKIFSLIGAFSGSIICYVAPALFYGYSLEGSWFSRHKLGALAMLVCGTFFLIAGTGASLHDMLHAS